MENNIIPETDVSFQRAMQDLQRRITSPAYLRVYWKAVGDWPGWVPPDEAKKPWSEGL